MSYKNIVSIKQSCQKKPNLKKNYTSKRPFMEFWFIKTNNVVLLDNNKYLQFIQT